MNRILLIIIIIVLLLVGSYFLFFKNMRNTTNNKNPEKSPATINGARIAMIIAFKDFRDEEYFTPREIFDKAKAEVKVVSDKLGMAIGADGGEVNVDIKLSDLKVADFDVIVFIGGPGTLTHLDNSDSYKIAQDAVSQNKILASICISPVILAKAGVLQGRKATVWTSALDKSAIKILEDNGAIFQSDPVVQDGRIITGNGPEAAKDFAEKIIEVLSK